MDVRKIIGWNLRRLRVAKSISQDDLALSAGIERAYAGHLERGTKNPTVLTLAKIAEALDVPIVEFFREVDPDQGELQPLQPGRRRR